MNEVMRPGGVDLATRIKSGLQRARAQTVLASGMPLLRLLKSGKWVFGQENNVVQAGSKWVLNVMSLQHGWSCWTDDPAAPKNVLKGEAMVSAFDDKPVQPSPFDGRWPWKEQFAADMKCVSGDDAGTQIHYKGTAYGMKKLFIQSLIPAIERQVDADPVHLCPIVKLEVSSYQDPKYGETFQPVFAYVGWADMDGNSQAGPPIAAPSGATTPVEPMVEPVKTQATRTAAPAAGRRRRPAGR